MSGTKQKQGGYPPHSFLAGAIAANHPSQPNRQPLCRDKTELRQPYPDIAYRAALNHRLAYRKSDPSCIQRDVYRERRKRSGLSKYE